ncbi:MAG TPA: hypothetical protein VG963_06885, partial [Polyangiaceae bacterium]|nr:hypothetical protein [Polyangiaceae bacterium]
MVGRAVSGLYPGGGLLIIWTMPTLQVDNPFTLNAACELPLAEWADIERVLQHARVGARVAEALSL